jgi:hypothetical protein
LGQRSSLLHGHVLISDSDVVVSINWIDSECLDRPYMRIRARASTYPQMFYSVGLAIQKLVNQGPDIHDIMALISTTGESHLLQVESVLPCQSIALKVLFREGGKQRSFTAARSKP